MKKEYKALTGIRGIAALWVLVLHFRGELTALLPSFSFFKPIYSIGHYGVDLFFILSGFIITYVYARDGVYTFSLTGIKSFLHKRFARVYPNYITTLAIYAAMVFLASVLQLQIHGQYGWGEFALHALLLNAFPFADSGAWNYPAWSVSAEFFGYLLIFPLCMLLIKKTSVRKYGVLLSFLLLALHLSLINLEYIQKWSPLTQIVFQFTIGSLLYVGLKHSKTFVKQCTRYSDYLFLVVVVSLFILHDSIYEWVSHTLLIMYIPILLVSLFHEKGGIHYILSRRLFHHLGVISYALYISHSIVQKVTKVIIPAQAYAEGSLFIRLSLFIALPLMCVIIAALLYHFVEEPCRKWLCKKQIKERV